MMCSILNKTKDSAHCGLGPRSFLFVSFSARYQYLFNISFIVLSTFLWSWFVISMTDVNFCDPVWLVAVERYTADSRGLFLSISIEFYLMCRRVVNLDDLLPIFGWVISETIGSTSPLLIIWTLWRAPSHCNSSRYRQHTVRNKLPYSFFYSFYIYAFPLSISHISLSHTLSLSLFQSIYLSLTFLKIRLN